MNVLALRKIIEKILLEVMLKHEKRMKWETFRLHAVKIGRV